MLRHKKLIHEVSLNETDNEEEDLVTHAGSDQEISDEDDSSTENEDEEEIDSEAESVSEDEGRYSIWTYLTNVANKDEDLRDRYQDAKERLDDDELSEEQIASEASRVVKPYTCDNIFKNYSALLKIMHFADQDPYHQQVLKTKRRLLMEEIDDPVEAIELAVKKRRYTIKKATNMYDDDDDEILPPPPDSVEDESEAEVSEHST